jgi:photosynthetic reaction center cytochrome c subunit
MLQHFFHNPAIFCDSPCVSVPGERTGIAFHVQGAAVKKPLFVFALVCVAGSICLAAPANAQAPQPPADKTAGEFFKNVQVLKDLPASEFTNGMWFIAGSLGVPCQHCHVAANERDDKQAKLTARKMIQMTRDLNAANFGGKQVVTCNTCHQGSIKPNGVPKFWGKAYNTPEQVAAYLKERQPGPPTAQPGTAAQPTPAPAAVETLPSVETILANYRKAIGTTPITSMRLTAELDADVSPQPVHIEINRILPDKVEQILNTQGATFRQIVNGDRGWNIGPNGTTDLPPAQIAALKTNAGFSVFKLANPDNVKKVIGIEKIGDRSYYVAESLVATNRILFYFDAQTGLLFKSHLEVTTPLGMYPADTVYGDYREDHGIKMPYLLTLSGTSGGARYKFTEIQFNVPVDPKRFEAPPPASPK